MAHSCGALVVESGRLLLPSLKEAAKLVGGVLYVPLAHVSDVMEGCSRTHVEPPERYLRKTTTSGFCPHRCFHAVRIHLSPPPGVTLPTTLHPSPQSPMPSDRPTSTWPGPAPTWTYASSSPLPSTSHPPPLPPHCSTRWACSSALSPLSPRCSRQPATSC